MTDDELERKLHERLHAAQLPPAPETLRRALKEMPEPETTRPRRRRGLIFLAAAALAVVGLGTAALIAGGHPEERADVVPSPGPAETPTASLIVPSGWVAFEAPGIRFAHPADWERSSAFDTFPGLPGERLVATFARGLTVCPNAEGVSPIPTTPSGGCDDAGKPGTLIVSVRELIGQLPVSGDVHGAPTMFGGYRAWTSGPYQQDDPSLLQWDVAGPDNSIYQVSASIPLDEVPNDRAEVGGALETLQLSSWQAPPKAVDGWVHLVLDGFALDYPAGWTVYYPRDFSMAGAAVVTIASRPLEPPCDGDSCQRFTTPPDTIAVEFSLGSGPQGPDWTKATESVGGQPAFVEHWGSAMATSADEGTTWNVRFDSSGRQVLDIGSSLRGPDLPGKRVVVDEILGRVSIDAPPLTTR